MQASLVSILAEFKSISGHVISHPDICRNVYHPAKPLFMSSTRCFRTRPRLKRISKAHHTLYPRLLLFLAHPRCEIVYWHLL